MNLAGLTNRETQTYILYSALGGHGHLVKCTELNTLKLEIEKFASKLRTFAYSDVDVANNIRIFLVKDEIQLEYGGLRPEIKIPKLERLLATPSTSGV